tara:strand:+ start:866 stop:1177 length:312 start_codon:yes stop_codon:yes gene_type:complete
MKYEKVVNGWDVKLYNPDDSDKPEENREVLLEKKYKTIKEALEDINLSLKPYDIKVSQSTIRKICNGSYYKVAGNSKTAKSIVLKKCKIIYEYVQTTESKIKN